MDLFDREFSLRYPGIVFARHLTEVYISVPVNEKVLFDEEEGYSFFLDVGLTGVHYQTGPYPCLVLRQSGIEEIIQVVL